MGRVGAAVGTWVGATVGTVEGGSVKHQPRVRFAVSVSAIWSKAMARASVTPPPPIVACKTTAKRSCWSRACSNSIAEHRDRNVHAGYPGGEGDGAGAGAVGQSPAPAQSSFSRAPRRLSTRRGVGGAHGRAVLAHAAHKRRRSSPLQTARSCRAQSTASGPPALRSGWSGRLRPS